MTAQANTTSGKRILLVEDERGVRQSLRLLLARDAHTVVEANNGAEALILFRTERFDLVVTDFEMPFVKGDELAVRIKQLAPEQPILMITAYDHRPTPDNPADTVLTKPVDASRVRDVVARLLSETAEEPNSPALAKPLTCV